MRDGVCVKCGATQVYRVQQEGPTIVFGGIRGFTPVTFGCLNCGYLEQYASEAGLKQLAKHGEPVPSAT